MNLTTHRNHLIAARFYARASAARRAALENDIALIEQGIEIPEYCRIDAAQYYANQVRCMRARAVLTRRGIWTS